jgi:DNA-binding response OmpR family regulator
MHKVREKLIDAIMIDINLPQINGLELIRMVREEDKELLIVVITAENSEETRIKAMRFGANYYLVKPYSANCLKLTLGGLYEKII